MFFGVAADMMDALRRSGRTPRAIILRLHAVPYIDASGVTALESFARRAHASGTRVLVCELSEQPRQLLTRLWQQHDYVTVLPSFQAALAQVTTDKA
jgi:SulP family sulfate permease